MSGIKVLDLSKELTLSDDFKVLDIKVLCIICGCECGKISELENKAFYDDPYGTIFDSRGNWGSTHLDLEQHEHCIIICNNCFPKIQDKILVFKKTKAKAAKCETFKK